MVLSLRHMLIVKNSVLKLSHYGISSTVFKLQPSQIPALNKPYVEKQQYLFHERHFRTSPCSGTFEKKSSKSLALWSNIKEVKASPMPALTLGLAGLIPFVFAPAYMLSCGLFMPQLSTMQLAYGASILSFLGGVRWGFTLYEENPVKPDWVNLGYSVIPSLIAWIGLILPNPISVVTVMTGLTFSAYCDMAMYGYPAWFKGLRFLLSFVAILSLWTTFICSIIMKEKVNENIEPIE